MNLKHKEKQLMKNPCCSKRIRRNCQKAEATKSHDVVKQKELEQEKVKVEEEEHEAEDTENAKREEYEEFVKQQQEFLKQFLDLI